MTSLPENYRDIITRLKEQIRAARIRAAFAANATMLQLYWEIGNSILGMQASQGWGSKVIDNLSTELRMEFPDFKGLSVRNLKYMVTFARLFPLFGQQHAAQIGELSEAEKLQAIGQQAAAQLLWGHLQLVMDKAENEQERLFYIQKCLDNGWSRPVLAAQIESKLHLRQGKSLSNFKETLPPSVSDLVQETIKNPYIFDFVLSSEVVRERDLENALTRHIKSFMLELGRGFAYVGRQKNLVVDGDDFFLDLLFFNYELNCFVVFELKVGEFKPEYAGKLNFYVNAINQQIKAPTHAPTIGVLLCKTPNETVVRYALSGIENPIGVSEFGLNTALPDNLKGEIPTVEEFEAEIEKELREHISPADKKLQEIKAMMASLNQPKVQEKRNPENTLRVLQEMVFPLRAGLQAKLQEITTVFEAQEWMVWTSNQGFETDQALLDWLAANNYTHEFRLEIRLSGFMPAGPKAFNIWKRCTIWLQDYVYVIGTDQHLPQNALLTKLYHELPNQLEWSELIDQMALPILEEIEVKLKEVKGVGHE
jgi:predicted nuclease of restriction endonuclease-like (RecB) superfamily